jgi:hypothetical protein
MATLSTNWDSTFTSTSINASTITNTSTSTTAAINNSGKVATEISVTIAYGGTANQGAIVNVLRMVDDTPTYESGANDAAWGFAMPYAISTTYHRTFTVSAEKASKFEVYVSNNSGASVTATVNFKQMTISIA